MGRKRREGPEALPLPLLLFCFLLHGVCGLQNVGCLFSNNVCDPVLEKCYNDLVFGRCIRTDGYSSENDFYQYSLEPEELDKLRVQLERLEFEGYKWPDRYTQCVMGILLEDLRYSLRNDAERMCKHLSFQEDGYFEDEKKLVNEDAVTGPGGSTRPVAIVNFTPSKINPHGEFADEFYYPPEMRQRMTEERRKPSDFDDYDEGLYDKLSTLDNPDEAYHRGSRSLSKASLASAVPASYPKSSRALPREYVEALQSYLDNEDDHYRRPDDSGETLEFLPSLNGPPSLDGYKTLARKYEYPKETDEALDFLDQRRDVLPVIEDFEDEDEEDYAVVKEQAKDGFDDASPIPRSVIDSLALQPSGGLYGESGTVVPLSRDFITPEDLQDYLVDMFRRQEMAGFKRRERLDVKKPGPPFSTNNYAFRTESSPPPVNESSDDNSRDNEVIYLPQQVKKEVLNLKFSSLSNSYDNVDLDHVYVQFNQEFHSWSEGDNIVNLMSSLIGLAPGDLKDIRVGRAEVTFKVAPNGKNYNATDIINKIDEIRTELQKQLKIQVIRAGIGDKAKLPAILEVSNSAEMSLSLFGTIVAVGVAAVSAAAIVILVIARQHAKSRAKLAGLRTPDPEASKDYQELCRARMQAKQSDKLSESPKGFDFGRLIESGKCESNRSSTSSWCEEPQVTNMDIATGHIVLSYMEEHLKNQNKIEEEWAALCAYEAEPCSTAVAEAEGNAECNRSGAALPYDHSRVILNDLANLNNSDYINASTITDHDPRNPAYIATQGALPQTAADFWQLVWEQGSVVIVMLTRLAEGTQSMCERYWPDEGSELYHTYEVHLVSEHIWCDDYLVRSFYLKNLRTGETRTVTQFQFLSWKNNGVPQSTKALLEFRRKVNKSYRGRSCPIIVHCNDGAGRTGTYCLIDMVLNRMTKGAKEIDIVATLEHIRDQRPGMVANKQQYEFVLMAVAEEVHAILKSLPLIAEKSASGGEENKPSTSAAASKSDM